MTFPWLPKLECNVARDAEHRARLTELAGICWCFGSAMLQRAPGLPIGYESFWNADERRARPVQFRHALYLRLAKHLHQLGAPPSSPLRMGIPRVSARENPLVTIKDSLRNQTDYWHRR